MSDTVNKPLVPCQVTLASLRAFVLEGYRAGWLDVSAGAEVLQSFLAIVYVDEDVVEQALEHATWLDDDEAAEIADALEQNDPEYVMPPPPHERASPLVKNHYVVSLYGGNGGIYVGTDQDKVRRRAIRDVGVDNFQSVKPATEDDVAWHEGMGGRKTYVA